MLDLHGAMVVQGYDDGEAELLRRIREVAPDVPIAVALDFHGNLSPALVERANIITGYRTYPHVDMGETGDPRRADADGDARRQGQAGDRCSAGCRC